MMQVNKWNNCYDDGWQGIIVPEAFSHPAKMSYGLLKRIFEHARDNGWIKPKDNVLDPFGGIGSTGIIGAYADLNVICVELEQKFVDLAEQNFKLHDNAWQKFGNPRPVIIQGDSRRLCEVVEKADCIVSSPPFMENNVNIGAVGDTLGMRQQIHDSKPRKESYGQTPGQLGSMKLGNVDMVVSSPPYAETLKGDGTQSETAKESRDKRRTPGGSLGQSQRTQGYGSKGNLGNLKSGDVDCVISRPPCGPTLADTTEQKRIKHGAIGKSYGEKPKRKHGGHTVESSWENIPDNLGHLNWETRHGVKSDTFWSAAKIIVEQCHQILRPGGHAIWVVKSFVRNKKIVDFPGDWQKLCESVGFKTVCVHHAMLVKEMSHKTLFGHTEVKRKERKSFFRRLAESKGSPRIDFEVVLCMDTPK